MSLLSSNRSNEDIQSELVEILGFEGQGLQLVEGVLKPGAREVFVDDGSLSGVATPHGKVITSDFAGIIANGTSARDTTAARLRKHSHTFLQVVSRSMRPKEGIGSSLSTLRA